MKIRSITYFCNPGWPLDEKVLRQAGEFLSKAKAAYEAAGYAVQTKRLATIPFPKLLGKNRINELPSLAKEFDQLIGQIDVDYGSLGPALLDLRGAKKQRDLGGLNSFAIIPEAVAATKNVFFSGIMADKSVGIDLAAVRACADVIVKCGPLDPNGFANLRFAALANVNTGAPFFPAAYHEGDPSKVLRDTPAFAIATEAADLAVEAFTGSKTVDGGRKALVAEIEKHGKAIAGVVSRELGGVIRESGVGSRKSTCTFGRATPDSRFPAFLGIDFSLAPFPAENQSLGTAFERLGVPAIGLHGSLAAAAILTEAIDRADFPRD